MKRGLGQPWGKQSPAKQTPTAIKTLIKVYPPLVPKWRNVRHTLFSQLEKEHESGNVGLYHFALWIQTRHSNNPAFWDQPTRGATLSKDILATGQKFEAAVHFFWETAPLTQAVGLHFQAVDSNGYTCYQATYDYMSNWLRLHALDFSEQACFLRIALLSNLCARPHWDASNSPNGWVAICAFGDFYGGELVVPELDVTLSLWPGNTVFLQSTLFVHYVRPFQGTHGSMVFFKCDAALIDVTTGNI